MSLFVKIAGIFLVFIALFVSCTSTQSVVKQTEMAEIAYKSGDCETALALYEKLIAHCEQNETMSSCMAYEQAARSANCLGQKTLSESYFKLAVYHKIASPSAYAELASMYRAEGNVSKEIMILEPLEEIYPQSNEAISNRARLFELGVVSEQDEMAVNLWDRIDDTIKTENLWTYYFQANRRLGHNESCNKIALELLNINDNNEAAMEWEAHRYYQLAEVRYEREMKAYESNKTHKQYARLTKELEKATADMKMALDYFTRLYAAVPKPEYALYLYNIFARFGDKKQTDYYRQRLNK